MVLIKERKHEIRYNYSGIDSIWRKRDLKSNYHSFLEEVEIRTVRKRRWTGVPSEEVGNTDDGWIDHLIQYCDHIAFLHQ